MVRFLKFNIQDSQLTFLCSGIVGDSRDAGVEDTVVREANALAALRSGDEPGPDNRCDIAGGVDDVTGSSDLTCADALVMVLCVKHNKTTTKHG